MLTVDGDELRIVAGFWYLAMPVERPVSFVRKVADVRYWLLRLVMSGRLLGCCGGLGSSMCVVAEEVKWPN